MFCIKFSLYRLAVVSKCYRDSSDSSLMECEKFTFKETGNASYKLVVIAIVVNSNNNWCTGYYIAFNRKTAVQF